MCIKRIATILFVLLGYIAMAGAMQSIIRHFVPPAPETRYAEVRINAIVHIRTVLPENAVVPLGWIAVGDPAQILPPDYRGCKP